MQNPRNCSESLSPADTLIACENETWSLIKRKDLKGFASYLAEDFYDIFPDGEERTKSELLEFLSSADLKDYRLSNFRVTMLNQDAADRNLPSRCACLNSGKRDFDEKFRDEVPECEMCGLEPVMNALLRREVRIGCAPFAAS